MILDELHRRHAIATIKSVEELNTKTESQGKSSGYYMFSPNIFRINSSLI